LSKKLFQITPGELLVKKLGILGIAVSKKA
jgi:hypothetical protein